MHDLAILFDLDGTLADTLTDIAAAGNHALRTLGRPPLPVARYRYLAGQGLPYLIEHALAAEGTSTPAQQEAGIAAFRTFYAQHKYDHTGPFVGLPAVLDELTVRGVRLAVLSNKPHDATVAVVADLFGRWQWDAVAGAKPGVPLKPDAGAALAIADELDIPAERWVYVGDTRVDMETGKAAGMYTIGVTWGFRDEAELREHGADAIVHQPAELLAVVEQLNPAT
ncbi:MAG: HAD family hydrolase [Phycisphaeraceae bacterium]